LALLALKEPAPLSESLRYSARARSDLPLRLLVDRTLSLHLSVDLDVGVVKGGLVGVAVDRASLLGHVLAVKAVELVADLLVIHLRHVEGNGDVGSVLGETLREAVVLEVVSYCSRVEEEERERTEGRSPRESFQQSRGLGRGSEREREGRKGGKAKTKAGQRW
jgi:hypothetical protein